MPISFVVSHFIANSAIPQMHYFLVWRYMRVTVVYSVTFIVDLHPDDPGHPNVFDAYYRSSLPSWVCHTWYGGDDLTSVLYVCWKPTCHGYESVTSDETTLWWVQCRSDVTATVRVASRPSTSDGQTRRSLGPAGVGCGDARNQLRPRTDPRKSAAGDRLSARDTSPRVRIPLAACRRVYHKTNSASERAGRARRRRSLSANASGWITAPCVDARPTASALIWRRQRWRGGPVRWVTSHGPAAAAAAAARRRLYIVAVRRAAANAAD